jgi:hypothetical protein
MRRSLALAAYALGVVLFMAFVVVPFLTKERDIPAAVPSPPPLTAIDLVTVPGGGQMCMTDLAISAESRQLRFKIGSFRRKTPPLAVSVAAAGYSGSARVSGGLPDNSALSVPIPKPPGGRLATVCIRNLGERRIAFYAASDRAHSRVHVFVNHKSVYPTPTLSFAEAGRVSIAERAGVTVGRIAVFRGFLDHAWIVWLVAVGVLVGVPVLVGTGLVVSERQPRSDSSAE